MSRLACAHANIINPFSSIIPSLCHAALHLPESTNENPCTITINNTHYQTVLNYVISDTSLSGFL